MGIAASSLAMAGCLILVEVGLRLFWEPPDRLVRGFSYDRYMHLEAGLGMVPNPDTIVRYTKPVAKFRVNRRGFRGPEYPISRTAGLRRVVVLGDSFAWGHGVSSGKAFPELLDEVVPDLEVINLGVPGFDLRQEMVYYRERGVQYQPDAVIIAVCQNDIRLRDRSTGKRQLSLNQPSGQPIDARRQRPSATRRAKAWCCKNVATYEFCVEIVNRHAGLTSLAIQLGIKEPQGGFEMLDYNLHTSLRDYPPVVESAMRQFRGDLGAGVEFIRENGAEVVLAIIPVLQAVDSDEFAYSLAYTSYSPADFDLDKPYRLISRFAEEEKTPVVCPLEQFRLARERGERWYLRGDSHFNEEGHRHFAEALRPALGRVLPKQAPSIEDTHRVSGVTSP